MASSKVSIDAHDHGKALDPKRKKVECIYCSKVVSGFCRLKYHIGGIRGDVIPCEQVPPYVKELMRNNLLDRKKGMLGKKVGQLQHPDLPLKRNWCPSSSSVKSAKLEDSKVNVLESKKRVEMDSVSEHSVMETDGVIGSQAAGDSGEEKDSSSRQFQKCIGRFFYETGLDISVVESPSFQRMMKVSNSQVEFAIPSCQDLKGWILKDEVKEMQQYVDAMRHSWAVTGCSILLDGWTDGNGRNLLNFLVDCPQGVIYLQSADISSSVGDVDVLLSLFDAVIKEVGAENVIQIVSYSTSDYMQAVGKHLMEKHESLFWTVSASHCLELMLRNIEAMDCVREVLEKAKTITKFIHNRASVLELFRNHSNGHDMFKSSRVKTASRFLTLENIVTQEESLKNMFSSSEWNSSIWASRAEGKRVADLVGDGLFWSRARHVLGVAIPVVSVLCLIDKDDKHRLGYIYETMDQAKETICDELNRRKDLYMPFWELIDWTWNNYLHSPLHSAGYFLNPSLRYSSDFCYDSEVGSGLMNCLIRLGQDQRKQGLLNYQMVQYQMGNGVFRVGGEAMKRRNNLPPDLWWSNYGGHSPELQRLAIRILSQTCDGASKYRLNRSLVEKLLAKGRSCREQRHLKDLIYLHYNLHLKNFRSGENHGTMDGEIDWIADETQGAVSQNNSLERMDLDSGDATGAGEVTNGEVPSSSKLKAEPK